nr:hypothetical protein [Tanacetum cinerariifolium]
MSSTPRLWTTAEEIALCKAWCDVSKNRVNTLNLKGFGKRFLLALRMKWGRRSDDTMPSPSNGNNRFVLKLQKKFVYERVKQRDENGSSDLFVFQNALAEYETQYSHAFTLELCWRILKNCPVWTEVEMPLFNRINN